MSSVTLILPDPSFSLLACFAWDVKCWEDYCMAIASSYVRFEVLFPPEPASGLPLYTRLSPSLRLTTMWIWSSRCERSFPVHPVRSEVTSHSTHVFSLLLVVVGDAGLNHSLDERPGQWLVRTWGLSLVLWILHFLVGQLVGRCGLL